MPHFGFGGKKCTLRCPKCRGDNLWLAEVWDGNGIYFHVEKGIMPGDAEDHFQGASVSVNARCLNQKCRHEWRVRNGVTSIYDLVAEEADPS